MSVAVQVVQNCISISMTAVEACSADVTAGATDTAIISASLNQVPAVK